MDKLDDNIKVVGSLSELATRKLQETMAKKVEADNKKPLIVIGDKGSKKDLDNGFIEIAADATYYDDLEVVNLSSKRLPIYSKSLEEYVSIKNIAYYESFDQLEME